MTHNLSVNSTLGVRTITLCLNMCVTRHHDMRKLSISDKEELYDVIAALSASIRELTKEIVELTGILIIGLSHKRGPEQ